MKNKFLLIFIFISHTSFSQEINLEFFEKLNNLSIKSLKEILVDGYGFYEINENKFLHPKSNEYSALQISIEESEFQNKTRIARSMQIISFNYLNIFNFKSELLEYGYNYVGKSDDPSINLVHYKKGIDNEIGIITIQIDNTLKYQIFFNTRL